MEWIVICVLVFAVFIAFSLFGVPIAYALGSVAVIMALILWPDGFFVFAANPFGKMYNFDLISLPLFIFMAEMIAESGAAEWAFDSIRKWMFKLPGGLAVAGELGCTIFAAISGASTATAATIGKIAVPEMLKHGYDKKIATGSIAAGGALGVLIPPSVLFILYGVLAEVSIGRLFIGGIVPGLILSGLFIAYIVTRCIINPKLAPYPPKFTWKERFAAAPKILPIMFLVVAIIAILYLGIATPTEVAAVGALFAVVLTAIYKKLNWTTLKRALAGTIRVTAFVGWIMVAAVAFGVILTKAHVPQNLATAMVSLPIPPICIIIMMNLFLIFMGCVMDPAAILMVLSPIFIPIIIALGYDPVWFGVVFVVNMELAEITPPLGLNLYILRSIAPPEVTTGDILKGVVPFMALDIVALILVIAFPALVLWLPSQMFGG